MYSQDSVYLTATFAELLPGFTPRSSSLYGTFPSLINRGRVEIDMFTMINNRFTTSRVIGGPSVNGAQDESKICLRTMEENDIL